ncbi:hypothetical protein Tcan_14547 [Toxocara canis]|uniref:F-box domain-containing protein n=1 Tax=Toxocara canis TaxID=6265 RepID=A0A0B2UYW6_TOXCA|nr:hypothetical protein Tcan_14547 [Toxocara canis]
MRSVRKLFFRTTNALKNRLVRRGHGKLRITSLPPELQLNIISFLQPEDVLMAKRVCRQWHHLITQYPTSTQRFPIELTIRLPTVHIAAYVHTQHALWWVLSHPRCAVVGALALSVHPDRRRSDGERDVWLEIKRQSQRANSGRQLFTSKFEIALKKINSWDDLLRHCIVKSIVLDGNISPRKVKWKETGTSRFGVDIAASVTALLQLLKNAKRLSELRSFSAYNWTVVEGEYRMIEEILQLAINAPLRSFKIGGFRGLRDKLSLHLLNAILGHGIQNLEVDFQYFWRGNKEKYLSAHFLNAMLLNGAERRVHLRNVPYADNKVIELAENWSMQKLPSFTGRLMLRVMNAKDVLPVPHTIKHRINNHYNKQSFIEISIKHKNVVQLQTGTEIQTGAPLNLRMTAYSVGADIFSGETKAKIHVVNCGSSCIAINVRLNNRNCKVDPNFFVMFDTKDLHVAVPNDCGSQDSICFECFPFANLPTVLFDPAWFSPTPSYQEINIPLNQINA